MPGAGNSNFHDLTSFDLQFGMDEGVGQVAGSEFSVNGPRIDGSLPNTQTSVYNTKLVVFNYILSIIVISVFIIF